MASVTRVPFTMPDLSTHRNPDGTYNGVTAMAEASGLSPDEIGWTWRRLAALKAEGKDKQTMLAIVREEAKGKPWLAK